MLIGPVLPPSHARKQRLHNCARHIVQAALPVSFSAGALSCYWVAQISHDYFENAMAHFTNSIFNAIKARLAGVHAPVMQTRHAPTLQDPWQAHAQLNLTATHHHNAQTSCSKMSMHRMGSLSCEPLPGTDPRAPAPAAERVGRRCCAADGPQRLPSLGRAAAVRLCRPRGRRAQILERGACQRGL